MVAHTHFSVLALKYIVLRAAVFETQPAFVMPY